MAATLVWGDNFRRWMATNMADDAKFREALAHPACDVATQRMVVGLRAWAKLGAQRVVMPETYCAAIAATDTRGCLADARMPWPAFEIVIPPSLGLMSSGEPTTSLLVYDVRVPECGTKSMPVLLAGGNNWLTICASAGRVYSYMTFPSVAGLGEFEADTFSKLRDHSHPDLEIDAQSEKRFWIVASRIVGGVMLAIEAAKRTGQSSYSPKPPRVKHGSVRPNSFALGSPLKIDCRESIADFVQGRRRSAPSVTTLVRGHWTHQPYGPGAQLRRLQWIQPYWRGAGPILMRDVHVGDRAAEAALGGM